MAIHQVVMKCRKNIDSIASVALLQVLKDGEKNKTKASYHIPYLL